MLPLFPTPIDHVPLKIGQLCFQLDQVILRDRRRIRVSDTMSAYRRPNGKLEGEKTLAVTGKAEIAFQSSKDGSFPTSEDKRTFRKLRAEFSGGERGDKWKKWNGAFKVVRLSRPTSESTSGER